MSRLDIPMPEEGFGHRAGDRLVTCHPEDAEDNDYKEFKDDNGKVATMVPRCRVTGGILGFEDPGDRRYGKGFTRCWLSRPWTVGSTKPFQVIDTVYNYRPDGKECASV
jgi:hypothetical protein